MKSTDLEELSMIWNSWKIMII